MPGRATPATTLLDRRGIEYTLHSYQHDPAASSYGTEAAEALGIEPERVFKTLVVELDRQLAVAIVAVNTSLEVKALAAALGVKRAALATTSAAERATGYVTGGISPLGQRKRLPTVLDDSALHFRTVLCSAGRRGLEIELAPADLVSLTDALVAPIRT